jgi:hypothetical protein
VISGWKIGDASYGALYDTASKGTPPDQTALLDALNQTRPLSVPMREQVDARRARAPGRCVAAD